jgi:hydrogenase nickel incorporation protein HypA/HybF
MHEMSLAGGILKLVEDAALRERFAQVTRLRLEAGRFCGVEVRALRFAIDEPAGAAWCLQCSAAVEIQNRADPCPACGSHRLQATGGTELRVVEMLVQD